MAESNFSWLKVASFVGALLLLIIVIATIAGGVYLIGDGNTFRGIACILSGLLSGADAVVVYLNYQHRT